MRVRITNRRPLRFEGTAALKDNIFNEVLEDTAIVAPSPVRTKETSAKIVRPVAFKISSREKFAKDTPLLLRGVSAFSGAATVITPDGPCKIAEICSGDLVLTRDAGFQPVLWTSKIETLETAVEIAVDALGEGKPDETLVVSGRQRVLLTSPQIHERFGEHEVLARAGDLLHLNGFREVPTNDHMVALVFEHHQVLRVNDAWLDSLQPDREASRYLTKDQKASLKNALPRLKDLPFERSYPACRATLNTTFARQLQFC